MALDAAQPFDFEHKAVQTLKKQRMLKIGIVGFGTFGQFLAKRLVLAGHEVSFSVALSVDNKYQGWLDRKGNFPACSQRNGRTKFTPHRKLCIFTRPVIVASKMVLSSCHVRLSPSAQASCMP